jgi:hypothetical protein
VLEAALARGTRDLSHVIERAWRAGAVFDAWTERFDYGRWVDACSAEGIDLESWVTSSRSPGEALPWDHIDSGLGAAFLRLERERAYEGVTTGDCTFGPCTGCGVCPTLGVDNVIAGGERHGA